MILVMNDVLSTEDLSCFRGLFDEPDARPGADTAEGDLKRVKNNHQLALGERAGEVRGRVLGALNRSDDLAFAAAEEREHAPAERLRAGRR